MTRNGSEMSLKEESNDVLRNPHLTVSSSAVRKITLQEGKKGKVHPCTGTEALYRPYGP